MPGEFGDTDQSELAHRVVRAFSRYVDKVLPDQHVQVDAGRALALCSLELGACNLSLHIDEVNGFLLLAVRR